MLEIIGEICACIIVAAGTLAIVAIVITWAAGMVDKKNGGKK